MSIVITSISPNVGGPIGYSTDANGNKTGGQIVSISGTGLAGVTSVTIGGLVAPIVSVSATLVTVRTPPRVAAGVYEWTGGSVDVVVSDGVSPVTVTNGYTYLLSILERVVGAVKTALAAGSVQDGFNYDYSADQIIEAKLDPSAEDNGSPFPHQMVYVMEASDLPEERTSTTMSWKGKGVVTAWKPIPTPSSLLHEQAMMVSDVVRALMGAALHGMPDAQGNSTCEDFFVRTWKNDRWENVAGGSYAAVMVFFEFTYRHIWNDPTQNTHFQL